MSKKVFAFNIAKYADKTVPALDGQYSDEQQIWVGDDLTAYVPTDTVSHYTTWSKDWTGSNYDPSPDTSYDIDHP